jgi:hypothetical protein
MSMIKIQTNYNNYIIYTLCMSLYDIDIGFDTW